MAGFRRRRALRIGGTPEGVIAAAALKCMGGEQLGRLWPQGRSGARSGRSRRLRPFDGCSDTDDLVASDNCFFAATGITDGNLLKGVHFVRGTVTTQSLVMRSSSGTVRLVEARHRADKLPWAIAHTEPSPQRRTRRFGRLTLARSDSGLGRSRNIVPRSSSNSGISRLLGRWFPRTPIAGSACTPESPRNACPPSSKYTTCTRASEAPMP